MNPDPKGFYARLGVAASADAGAIIAAFRRQARRLHPDVPGTGDTAAFLRVKEAYEVLADRGRRAAYDQAASATAAMTRAAEGTPITPARWPRMSDLPLYLWLGFLALGGLAVTEATLHLIRPRSPDAGPASAPSSIAPEPPGKAAGTAPDPLGAPARPAGMPTHYVAPGAGAAVLWRLDATHRRFVPAATLAPFATVHVVGLVPHHGLLAVLLAGGGIGFVDTARLLTGSAADAHRAYCAYDAGPSPANGDVLNQSRAGPARVVVQNRAVQPAVVKLRDLAGRAEASVYIAPGNVAAVAGLPAGPWRAEVAFGELWSRACAGFIVGMRAIRLSGLGRSGGTLTLVTDQEGTAIGPEEFARD